MSLFGYSKDTTPKLKELAKEDNFYYTTGISGGVNTLSSCKFIVNAIYEPNNVLQVSGDLTNLFRLAKQKGFKTFYISSQSDHVLMSLGGVSYIDTITTNGVRGVLDATKRMDNELPDIVSDDKLGKRNFIVLHQRHMHSPYTLKEFPSLKEYKKYMSERVSCFKEPNQAGQKEQLIAEYDEGMLYNDCFITKIFNRFNKQKEGKFYIIWTSDHGELLGEDGTYGHSALNPYIADIPVMIQSNDLEFMKDMKNIWKPTHYEIAKKVANKLGYEIKNPNEEENIFYISGVDFTGRCGYIKLKKEIENSKITYEKYLT
jgi:glucan phosphoethanolaminetransferase (alkaline phosphatase superfamily)